MRFHAETKGEGNWIVAGLPQNGNRAIFQVKRTLPHNKPMPSYHLEYSVYPTGSGGIKDVHKRFHDAPGILDAWRLGRMPCYALADWLEERLGGELPDRVYEMLREQEGEEDDLYPERKAERERREAEERFRRDTILGRYEVRQLPPIQPTKLFK